MDGLTDTSACVYGLRGERITALGRPDLHDLAQVHHRDPVGEHPGQRQVVGDEQVRQAALAAQVEHQAQELGPDRDVEHRDRLVGDDQLGLHDQGPGDHHALALAAGELVRVAGGEVRGGAQAGGLERVEDALAALGSRVPMPFTSSGSATKSPIVCLGFSVSYGSWKISWTRRR